MKYVVLLCDGMADLYRDDLNGTPMSVANKPYMDMLCKKSRIGLVKTVADNLKPGSDVANLSVLGYDPAIYYSGRSPLEAGSIGIDMKPTDVSFRCNLVTLSDEAEYSDKTILDYCADDISTQEAKILIEYVQENMGTEEFTFYSGVSYRHCLVWAKGNSKPGKLTPPHDITGRPIMEYLPTDEAKEKLLAAIESYLAQYPSISFVLDIHRDAIADDDSTRVAPVAVINGQSAAQFMIIAGCDDGRFNMPDYIENFKLAALIQNMSQAMHEGLARPVLFDYRNYNQHITTGSLLIEIGSHANSLDEALYTAQLLGESMAAALTVLS